MSPSEFSMMPSEKPRDGHTSEAPAPVAPSISSVDGVRCQATRTPSRDGKETLSALAASLKRVLLPLLSKCALPATAWPATMPATPVRSILGPCLRRSARRLSGTPEAEGGASKPTSMRARLASLLVAEPLPASAIPLSCREPCPSKEISMVAVASSALPTTLSLRPAGGIEGSPALASAWGGGEPFGGQIWEEEDKDRLGARPGDAAVEVDLGFAELGRLAHRMGRERDVSPAGL